MLPLLLALPDLLATVGKLIGLVDHPSAKAAADAIGSVTSAIQSKEITPEQLADANAHLEAMAQIAAQQESDEQSQNAQTQRSEIASTDAFVRRARPMFTYAMAFAWVVQMVAVSALLFFNPVLAVQAISALGQMTGLWGIALSVVGIYHYGRTQEKRADAAANPALIQTLPQTVGGLWDRVMAKLPK